MTDRFSGYMNAPDEPYTDAVPLTPSEDEFEPTAALWVNTSGIHLSVVMMDAAAPVTIYVPAPGKIALRIKKLLGLFVPTIQDNTASHTFNDGEDGEFTRFVVLGLY